MNKIVGSVPASLLARLATQHHLQAPGSANVVWLAEARIRRELSLLPPLESRILRWRYGVGCTKFSDQQIAARLRLTVDQVVAIGNRAILELRSALARGSEAA